MKNVNIVQSLFTCQGSRLELPADTTPKQLKQLINSLLNNTEPFPYSFLLNEEEIIGSIEEVVKAQQLSSEEVLNIVYQPQAIFRVRPVTRCSSTVHLQSSLLTPEHTP